jgi:ABC-type uncharacterized transport system auxiliary subunit
VLTGISKNVLAIGLMIGFIASTSRGRIRCPDYCALKFPAPPSVHRIQRTTAGSMAVGEFRSPMFLCEAAIVYRPSADQIAFYHSPRWAEDPRRAVTDLMMQDLQASGFLGSIDVYNGGRGSSIKSIARTLC